MGIDRHFLSCAQALAGLSLAFNVPHIVAADPPDLLGPVKLLSVHFMFTQII